MFENLPEDFRSALYVAASILVFMFLLIIVKYSIKIFLKLSRSKTIKEKNVKQGFGIITLLLLKRRFSLKFSEIRFIKKIFSLINIPSAKIIVSNPELFYYYAKQYLEVLSKSGLNKQERNEIVNKLLDVCPKFHIELNKIKSTKLLPINTTVIITNELGGNFNSKIVDVNSRHILVSVPDKMKKHIDTLQDMILNVGISIPGDAYYEFTTFTTAIKNIGNLTFFQLAHSDKIERKQRRKKLRKKCKITACFYLLSLYTFEGKEKIMLHKKTMQSGYILNIAENGLNIATKNAESYAKNRLVKIEYNLNGRQENVVGKITNKKEININQRMTLHIEIIKQNSTTLQNTALFVYNIHPKYDNNVLIKTDEKDIAQEEKALYNFQKNPLPFNKAAKHTYAKIKVDVNDLRENKPGLIKKIKL